MATGSALVTTRYDVAESDSSAPTRRARATIGDSIVRNSVKNSAMSDKNAAPRMRSATKKNGREASDRRRDCDGAVSSRSNRLPKNCSMRRGASSTDSALRDGGVSTMTRSNFPLSRASNRRSVTT